MNLECKYRLMSECLCESVTDQRYCVHCELPQITPGDSSNLYLSVPDHHVVWKMSVMPYQSIYLEPFAMA